MTRGVALSLLACVVLALPLLWSAFTRIEGTGRAIDGDSLMVGDTEVRLWGVDAAEFDQPGGLGAYRVLSAIVDGQPVRCRRKQVWRSYRRVVAACSTLTHSDIARSLATLGHASDVPEFSDGYYRR